MAYYQNRGINVEMKFNIITDGPGQINFSTGFVTSGGAAPFTYAVGPGGQAMLTGSDATVQTNGIAGLRDAEGPKIQLLETSGEDLKPHRQTDKDQSSADEMAKARKQIVRLPRTFSSRFSFRPYSPPPLTLTEIFVYRKRKKFENTKKDMQVHKMILQLIFIAKVTTVAAKHKANPQENITGQNLIKAVQAGKRAKLLHL